MDKLIGALKNDKGKGKSIIVREMEKNLVDERGLTPSRRLLRYRVLSTMSRNFTIIR